MRTLILSDLHLGSPLFCSKNVISSIIKEPYKEIFILGDVIDVWEEKVETIKKEYRDLINVINERAIDIDITIVKGNHDPDGYILKDIFPNCIIKTKCAYMDNGTILIHGNENDHFIRDFSWVANVFYKLYKCLSRIGINIREPFRDLFYSIASKRGKNYFNDLVLKVEKETCDNYKRAYKNIVMGHTHLPKVVIAKDFRYVNCGDWIHNMSYVIYDEQKDKFILHDN